MSYTSRSFCNIEALISNAPGVQSPLGQLTTQAQTFTRDLGTYQNSLKPGYTIYNFGNFSSAANGGSGGAVVLDASVVNQGIALVDFCFNLTTTTNGQIDADQLLQQILTFGSTINVSNITLGPVQGYNNVNGYAALWMPTSITWVDGTLTDSTNSQQVWIDLAAFSTEYNQFSIVVVPPLTPLDTFFSAYSVVTSAVAAITLPQTMANIQAAKNGKPETLLVSNIYNYVNPLNTSQTIPVNWPVLIYGPAGNNVDSIKDAMMAYILANSSNNQASWTQIFPDIFKRTEFIIAPFWQNYAIPNMTLLNGIYSPVVKPGDVATYLGDLLSTTDYPTAHVQTNCEVLAYPYQSLAVAVIGSPDNRNGQYKFTDIFGDYIDVSTTSADFARMSVGTQQLLVVLQNLIVFAETMTSVSNPPAGVTMLTRNNILYASAAVNNIQFLVAAKTSVYTALGLSLT